MNGLSMHRVRLLLRNHVVSEYRSMLTPFAAIAILILLQSLVTDSYAERSSGMYDGWFGAVLLFWGVIVASRAFREMHDKTTNEAWFLLPASSAEKTLARALHVSVTFVLMQLAFFTLLAPVVELVTWIVAGKQHGLFNPFSAFTMSNWLNVLVAQAVFFLGSAWFRSLPLMKTVLSVALVTLVFFIVGSMLFGAIVSSAGPSAWSHLMLMLFGFTADNPGAVSDHLAGRGLGALLYYFVLPGFCYYVAWLRVKETQVSDGI
ncbi:MAG: hypothetical protein H6978_10935 [Gammaproteobacteria bacterium]|nr:hypothetical protein [Gammaproteobacteria bacterium]